MAAVPVEVISEQGIETFTRQIHRHLLGSGEPLRAMAYSRAFRWGKLALPPDEKGRTRIPKPRPGGLVEFRKALIEDSLEELLACSENLFFEPGFQLLFDLQFQTHQYLESNQRPDLAGFILNALLNLLERLPQLLDLQFDDGTPFAGPECRRWLWECRSAGMGESARTGREEETDGDPSAEIMDKAMQMAKRKKLAEALRSVRCLPSETARQRVRKRLAEARLCLAAGKAPMAEVVLTDVQKYILDHHLATWDPGLAVEILQQRLAALQSLEKGGSGENKELIAQQTQEVLQLICQIDMVAAATLI
jgi:type VI secretion system protein VasJ